MLCAAHVALSLCPAGHGESPAESKDAGGRRWGRDLDCNQAAPGGAAVGALTRFPCARNLLSNLASAARRRDLRPGSATSRWKAEPG